MSGGVYGTAGRSPASISSPPRAQVGCVISAAVTHPTTWAAAGERERERDGHVQSNEILVTLREGERERRFFFLTSFDGGGGKIPE